MASSFRLVIRSGVEVGKEFPLEKNELIVGREQSNDITISDPEVSRRHARIFFQNGSYVVEDLGSTNGTFVNGQRLTGPYILRPGEMLNFGEHVSVLYEATQIDPNATVVAGQGVKGSAQKPPIYAPPPAQPVSYSPPAGAINQPQVANVPAVQQPHEQEFVENQAPVKGGKRAGIKLPKWATIVVIIILIVLVLCILPVTIIDVTNQWCNIFGTIFNGITPGACP